MRPRLFIFLLASVLPWAASLSEDEFEVAPGISVTPAVLPGLVRHPMAAAFDDEGRLYIAESSGENLKKDELLEKRPHFIRLLTDTDGDGVFDQSQIFADRMVFPQGVLWVYDALYVMSSPSLWRLTDTDGDGVADRREELAGDFDFTGNAADVHGPFLHPDGRLFWCHGRKEFAVRDFDTGEVMESGHGARIWTSTLDGGEVETFSGGGLDNPVELDFTDRGEIIGSVNLFYGRPRGDTLTHWIRGGVYPRHDMGWALEGLRRSGPLLPEIHNFGHVAVSGMCRYRSGLLNPDWTDQWFVSHFNTSKITRTEISREGASFSARGTETVFRLLRPDSHLTDVLEDRNGDLLVIDTGGWFRAGCPNSQIAKPEIAGGIYRLSREGQPYQKPAYPDWSGLTSEAVSTFLDVPESWLQERAITELAVRGAPALPELKRILQSPESSPKSRRNAVWTLTRMKFSESSDLILAALQDLDPSVRQAASHGISVTRTWQSIAANEPPERAIELDRNRTIAGVLARIVRGDESPLAATAANALGRMAETRAIGSILGRLGRSVEDPFLEHSLVHALIEIDDFETTKEALASESDRVIRGALQALGEMPSSNLEALDVLPFLDSESADVRETAIEISAREPTWDAAIANRFFTWLADWTPVRESVIRDLAPRFLDSPPMQDFLTALLSSENPARRELGLEIIEGSESAALAPEWEPILLASLEQRESPELLERAVRAAGAIKSDAFRDSLSAIGDDKTIPLEVRLSALFAASGAETTLSESAFGLALEIIEGDLSIESREAAMEILGSSRLLPTQRDALAPLVSSFDAIEIRSFLNLFRKIDNERQAKLTAEAIVHSPSFPSLPINRLRGLYRDHPASLGRIEAAQESLEKQRDSRDRILEDLSGRIAGASPERGRDHFSEGKGACNTCHAIGNLGRAIGPDLSEIGRIRGTRDLLESILYPSESIARDFESVEIVRSDGPPRIGIISEREVEAVHLVDLTGNTQRIPTRTIELIRPLSVSLMPEGLGHSMSESELLDLVSYLASLTGKP